MKTDLAPTLIEESTKNLYHQTYLMVKAGKMSQTAAKKFIRESLLDIWAGKVAFIDDKVIKLKPEEQTSVKNS